MLLLVLLYSTLKLFSTVKQLRRAAYIVFLYFLPISAYSDSTGPALFEMTLEELMTLKVEAVNKQPTDFMSTARAVYVITTEDIQRSGINAVPELLRLAPGINVAQITSHRWAISIRGFQQEFASKLLVLIDGRTVYTPTYSGVYWDVNDLPVEEIERIEIVRGPASVFWGSNAMNGVINIITKSASDTQGTSFSASTGNDQRHSVYLSHGANSGEWNWRVYASSKDYDDREQENYNQPELGRTFSAEHWTVQRLGIKANRKSGNNQLKTAINFYDGSISDLVDNIPVLNPAGVYDTVLYGKVNGTNAAIDFNKSLSASSWSLRLFLDHSERTDANVNEIRDTVDIEFQHNFNGKKHNWSYGAGVRHSRHKFIDHLSLTFVPNNQSDEIRHLFAHDQWQIIDNWSLNYGIKIEDTEYTKILYQPAISLARTTESNKFWLSLEKAARLTNRVERDIDARLRPISLNQFGANPEGYISLFGDQENVHESMIGYELGYGQKFGNFYIDLSLFSFDYEDLIFFESEDNIGSPFINERGEFILPVNIRNTGNGKTEGLESSILWQLTSAWQIKANASFIHMELLGDNRAEKIEGETPKKQYHLRSFYNLGSKITLDAAIYYVDSLPGFNASFKSYTRYDLRLAYKPQKNIEISLSGQNIGNKFHREHNDKGFSTFSDVPESAVLKFHFTY